MVAFFIYRIKEKDIIMSNSAFQPKFNYQFIQFIYPLKPFTSWVLGLQESQVKNFASLNMSEKSKIIKDLVTYSILEPKISLNETCKPTIQMSLNCNDYSSTFNGEIGENERKPKIAHLIQYGFDTDVLEILLNEVYEYVDKFFIIESQVTHFGNVKKPLVWPLISKQNRFKRFDHKIVYFNISSEMIEKYSDDHKLNKKSKWRNEGVQEIMRFQMFLQWNKENNNYFSDDDIIGFGDVDEIPSFHNLILMKKCRLKNTTDIGIWFSHCQINKQWMSDFPVKGQRGTLGDPTYWYLRDAIQNGKPSRRRGHSKFFLLGGLHLTRYGYLPTMILKDLSMTEFEGGFMLSNLRKLLEQNVSLYDATKSIFYNDRCRLSPKNKDLNKNLINHPPYMIPWIMQCNPLRYPSFLENFPPDNRLN